MRDRYFSGLKLTFNKKANIDGTVSQDSNELVNPHDSSPSEFTSYIEDEEAFATILYKIAKNIYPEIDSWEMETLTIEITKRFPRIPEVNLDKIMAIIAMNSSFDGSFCFYNEVNCFRHTVNAFNNIEPNLDFMGELIPQHITWAMYEMDQQFPGQKLFEEPAKFLGLCFHNMGYFLLPENLSEYQEFLDYYNTNSIVKERIKKEWEDRTIDVEELDEDDIVDLQLLLLESNKVYLEQKKKKYKKDLALYK